MNIRTFSLLLPAGLLFCFSAAGQSNPNLLAQITTSDGRIYRQVEVVRVEPDGIVVNYQPERPGIGMAKLKFRNLPDAVRNQYGYDPQRATDFEAQQAQAMAQWRSQPAVDPQIQRYRAVAEWNRALAGDAYTSYSVSLDNNGKVSAQGTTGNAWPYAPYYYNASLPYGPVAMPDSEGQGAPKPGVSRGGGY